VGGKEGGEKGKGVLVPYLITTLMTPPLKFPNSAEKRGGGNRGKRKREKRGERGGVEAIEPEVVALFAVPLTMAGWAKGEGGEDGEKDIVLNGAPVLRHYAPARTGQGDRK